MKLESLKNGKFENSLLKKEQMVFLNGGLADAGTVTPAGQGEGVDTLGRKYTADYGYDSVRSNGTTTYHNRTNIVYL